jgi:hypothetical protein
MLSMPVTAGPHSSLPFEELDGSLVPLRLLARGEGAKVAAPSGAWIRPT